MTGSPTDPVLALPNGWLVDDLTRDRLERTLAAQPPEVAGIVARSGRPPAGGSYRSHAERTATRAFGELSPGQEQRISGGVLLRADRTFSLDGDAVVVDGGGLLVDRGAVVHDPWQPLGSTDHASPDGRSPFPYRPLVLLLGLEHDALLADWGRSVVNDLIRSDVEGRLAVPAPTDGLHLTVPSLPSEATVTALGPDVLLALDEEALAQATRWLDAAADRSTVTVLLTPGTESEPELVSWRIGEAQGRLRARVGRGTKGRVMADLARRLATGPVPVGPVDRPTRPDGQRLLNPRRALSRTPKGPPLSLVALVDPTATDARQRYESLFGWTAPPTHATVEPLTQDPPASASTCDVLLVGAPSHRTSTVADLISTRTVAGRPTILDVPGHPDPSAELRDLVRLAGMAVTTDDLRRDQLITDLGVRAFTLPTLLRPKRVAELAELAEQDTATLAPGRRTIGCDARDTDAEVQVAVRDALTELLERCPDLNLELLITAPGPLTELLGRGTVTLATTAPRPHELADRAAAIVTTRRPHERPWLEVVETQLSGVPVICRAGHPAEQEGLVTASLVVTEPTDPAEWGRVVDDLLHAPGLWDRRATDARAIATALYGPASARAMIDRFVGWLPSGGRR